MTPDEWRRVRDLFDQAERLEPAERPAFLDQACAGSPALRDEVHSLLEAGDRNPGFIEAPAYQLAADLLVEERSLAGRIVGPYVIRHEVGRGGMGTVYLADDTRLGRRVAVKAIHPDAGSDEQRRERMRQEARAAAGLAHAGIATVYALDEIDGELYQVSEYVAGQTLRALVASGPLPLAQVLDIAVQLARALAAAHGQGVVHRDLKPENIVLNAAGAIKVVDFGVARIEDVGEPPPPTIRATIGTPGYMAPEQIRHQPIDFRADLFAVGILIYELASGENPFTADSPAATIARILEADPPPLSTVCPEGFPALDRIVAKCLERDPRHRYASSRSLVADLERLDVPSTTEFRTDPVPQPAGQSTDARGAQPLTPRWWWEIHQWIASVVYILMLYPAWRARPWLPAPLAPVFFFVAVAAASSAVTIRLHLVFTARFYPFQLKPQRARSRPWVGVSDLVFAGTLLLAAIATGSGHPEVATLFVAVSITAAVASLLLEPATTAAAFPAPDDTDRRPTSDASPPRG